MVYRYNTEIMYVDTHCHLNFAAFKDDWREVADTSVAAGVEKMIIVGADLESSRRAVELASQHSALYAAVGLHPHHAREMLDSRFKILDLLSQLQDLAQKPRVVAIGEIGLDYHVPKKSKYPAGLLPLSEELQTIQRDLFQAQVKLAQELNLPLILHSREAKEEVLEIIQSRDVLSRDQSSLDPGISHPGIKGVFHCFAGSKQYLKRVVGAGFYVGFDGDITYEPGKALVASATPLDRLLLETDTPLLTPVPHRGQRNTPANVPLIAQKHADLRGISLAEVASQTSQNAKLLFRI